MAASGLGSRCSGPVCRKVHFLSKILPVDPSRDLIRSSAISTNRNRPTVRQIQTGHVQLKARKLSNFSHDVIWYHMSAGKVDIGVGWAPIARSLGPGCTTSGAIPLTCLNTLAQIPLSKKSFCDSNTLAHESMLINVPCHLSSASTALRNLIDLLYISHLVLITRNSNTALIDVSN